MACIPAIHGHGLIPPVVPCTGTTDSLLGSLYLLATRGQALLKAVCAKQLSIHLAMNEVTG